VTDSITGEGQAEQDDLQQRFAVMLMSKVMKRWTADSSYRCFKNWYANQRSDHRYLREVMNLAMEMHSEERTNLIQKMTPEDANQEASKKGAQAQQAQQKVAVAAKNEEAKKNEAQRLPDGPEKDEALKELKELEQRAERLAAEASQLEQVVDEIRTEQGMHRLRRAVIAWQTIAERGVLSVWKNNYDVDQTRTLAAGTMSKATGKDIKAIKVSLETDAAVERQVKSVQAMNEGPEKEKAQEVLAEALKTVDDAIDRVFQDPEEEAEDEGDESDTSVPRWVVRSVRSMPDGPAKTKAMQDIDNMQLKFHLAKVAESKEEEDAARTQAKLGKQEEREMVNGRNETAVATKEVLLRNSEAAETDSKSSARSLSTSNLGSSQKSKTTKDAKLDDPSSMVKTKAEKPSNPFAANAPVLEEHDFNVSDAFGAVVAVHHQIETPEDSTALKNALEAQQKSQAILILKQLFKSPAQVSRCAFSFFQWQCFLEEKRLEKRFDGVKARAMTAGMKIMNACVEGMHLIGDPLRIAISAWVVNVICSAEATSKKENKYLHKKKQQVWKKFHEQVHAKQDATEKFQNDIKEIQDSIEQKMFEVSHMNHKVQELQALKRISAFTNDRTAAEGGIVRLLDTDFSGDLSSALEELVDPEAARHQTLMLANARKNPHSPYNPEPLNVPWKMKMNMKRMNNAYRVQEKRVQILVYANDGGITSFFPDGALVVASNLYEVLDGAIRMFEEPYLRVLYSMKGNEVKLDKYQSLKPGMEFIAAPLGEAFKPRKASWQPEPRSLLPGAKKPLPGVRVI